ncbi:MAG: BT4734/BF3469 family protein [Candidatus Riflebacteria bacterium]|nr:BT4734/BF3469 family protein [Candidatus Riflebacteria bacterium]
MKEKTAPVAAAAHLTNDEYTPIQPIDAIISVYKNAKDKIGTISTVRKQLEIIKSGILTGTIERLRACPPLEYDKQKIWLPMAVFQGIFVPARLKENIQASSGLMILDFDHLAGAESEEIREKLRDCPFIFAAWRSPRNGVKALARVDFSNDEEFKAAYRSLSECLQREYGIEADPKCKDISRACFTSADPNLWIQSSADKFLYSMEAEPVAAVTRRTPVVIPIRSNPRLEGYVLAAINNELNNISNAPKGSGTGALYRAAIRAGELSHTGLYCRSAVEDHYISAFLNRKHSHNSREHARITFNNGWLLGEGQPRQLPSEVIGYEY